MLVTNNLLGKMYRELGKGLRRSGFMVRKLMSLLMCAVLMFTMTGTAFADVANTADDKLAAVEVTLYGTAQTGPLADRISKL